MGYEIVREDITTVRADVIINASNGEGYMGGILGKYIRFKGVAESIHYVTKGVVEKEAKQKARRNKYLPSWVFGHKAGEVFVTGPGSLKAKHIIHAVTMRYPGSFSKLSVIEKLLPEIMKEAYRLKANTVAIPLLGTGTGGISKKQIYELYDDFFGKIEDMHVWVIEY